MWRNPLRLSVVIVALVLLMLPFTILSGVALADNSAEVVVTATGYICESPGGFTVTYISDYEVGLSWAKGVDAENTLVRACIGRFPENREDGYLVYYGDGTSATDWVNMEFLSVPIYYQAWSQNASGIWEEGGSETGWVEGVTIMLFALMALALGLTITAYVLKKGALFFGAAGAWALLCGYSYTRAVSTSDIYFYLFMLCGGMVVVSAIGALTTRETKSYGEPDEDEDEDMAEIRESIAETERERQMYNPLYNRGRGKKKPPRRLSF